MLALPFTLGRTWSAPRPHLAAADVVLIDDVLDRIDEIVRRV
jgi:hypothetical protein